MIHRNPSHIASTFARTVLFKPLRNAVKRATERRARQATRFWLLRRFDHHGRLAVIEQEARRLLRARSTVAQPAAPRVTTETGKIPRSSRSTCSSRSSSRLRDRRLEVRGVGVERGDRRREVAVLALELVDLVDELARCRAWRGRCRPPRAGRDGRGAPTSAASRDIAAAQVARRPGLRGRRGPGRRARCARPSARRSAATPRHPQYSHTSADPVPAAARPVAAELRVVAAAVDDVGTGQVAERRAEDVHQPGERPQREERRTRPARAAGSPSGASAISVGVGVEARGTSGTRPRRPRGSCTRRRSSGSSRRWCSTCPSTITPPRKAYITLSMRRGGGEDRARRCAGGRSGSPCPTTVITPASRPTDDGHHVVHAAR